MNALNPPESRDTTCPECGTDHSDNMQRTLERKLAALRVENEVLRGQRDLLAEAVARLSALMEVAS